MELINLKAKLDDHMTRSHEEQWTIGDNIKVEVSLYKSNPYLGIRVWTGEGRPTKQGVTMPSEDWKVLLSHLNTDAESEMGLEVYVDLLKSLVDTHIKTKCEGCQNSWSSQLDHDCILNQYQLAKNAVDIEYIKVDANDFIISLAQKGKEKRTSVMRPYTTYMMIRMVMEKQIKQKVLDLCHLSL